MNLHSIAVGVISAVNPQQVCTVQLSAGISGYAADGTPIPAYAAPVMLQAQVQAMATRDLRQVDGLNLNGTYRRIYLYGDIEGTIRWTDQGGDLITFPGRVAQLPAGSVWLVVYPEETWPDWCSVVACLQNGS